MLFKYFVPGGDYKKTLRFRLRLFVFMVALGVVLIVLSLTVLGESDLPDFAKGFYLGAGSGMTLAGLFFVIRTARLLKNPEAARREEISETDERERAIVSEAMKAVFWVFYVVLIAGIFIALPLNRTVFYTLLVLLLLQSAAFLGALLWYRWKM